MNRRVFESISNYARVHIVKIDFEFDCKGDLIITMTRDTYSISRAISNVELNWVEDCENTIFYRLNTMLEEINKNYDKQI